MLKPKKVIKMHLIEYIFFIENRNLKTETDMHTAKMSVYKKGLAEDMLL